MKQLQHAGARKAEEEALAVAAVPPVSHSAGIQTKAQEEALAIKEMLKSEGKEETVLGKQIPLLLKLGITNKKIRIREPVLGSESKS